MDMDMDMIVNFLVTYKNKKLWHIQQQQYYI